jgi:quinoprotein relay system zinc metallohydrolase 2
LPLLTQLAHAVQSKELVYQEILPGVFLRPGVQQVSDARNRGHIANLGFIVGEQKVAVIDAGGSRAEGEAVLRAVRRVTNLPIAYLILTHMHPDHTLGSGVFAQRNIEIIGHARLADALRRRQSVYLTAALEYLGDQAEGTGVALPDSGVGVGETRELDLGGRRLELRAYPTAHTDNDLTVRDSKTGLLWLSDLLFQGRIPVIDGSLLGWLAVIDGLAKLDATLVVPGHGTAMVDWKPALQRQRDYLQAVAEGVRREIHAGRNIRHAVKTVGLEEEPKWLLFPDYHGRNVTAAFVELEWE